MNKFHFLSFLLWAVAIWGIWAFAFSSKTYILNKQNFQSLKAAKHDYRLTDKMRDELLDKLTIQQNEIDEKLYTLTAGNKQSDIQVKFSCKGSYTTRTSLYPDGKTPACYEEREIRVHNGNSYHGGWWPSRTICIARSIYTTQESCKKAWFDRGVANQHGGDCDITPARVQQTTHSCETFKDQNSCSAQNWCRWDRTTY